MLRLGASLHRSPSLALRHDPAVAPPDSAVGPKAPGGTSTKWKPPGVGLVAARSRPTGRATVLRRNELDRPLGSGGQQTTEALAGP